MPDLPTIRSWADQGTALLLDALESVDDALQGLSEAGRRRVLAFALDRYGLALAETPPSSPSAYLPNGLSRSAS